MKRLLACFLAFSTGAIAADCLQDQQRQSDSPSGQQIVAALTSSSQLDNVCAGNWRVGDQNKLNITFNHGSMFYYVERTDNTQHLRYCKDAFNNILEQCVTNGNYWGGTWSWDGETYKISDSVYPANGLASTDDGGPTDPNTGTGPITAGPQTTTESGSFATSTASISGLTANTATTTSADGHATILPIWFVSPGVGIILIPGPGVTPGGIIPPPPGYPPLVIDENGQVHEDEDDGSSSSSSTTNSCSTCASCAGFDILSDDATSTLENDGDPDLPTIDASIWASMEINYSLSGSVSAATTTTPSSSTPTQSAGPIDKPGCQDAPDSVKSDLAQWTTKGNGIRLTDGSYHPANDVLYMVREVVCDGSCKAPSAIDSKYVAVYQKDGLCEVSVALSSTTELFVNRDTWPDGNDDDFDTIWQQCWDSTQNIIDKCVSNQAKVGWWNGDHVYQFYEAGVRSLNDPNAHHTQNGISLGSYLEPSTEGLSCKTDCCGYLPNADWCNQNCGGICRRGNRWNSANPKNLFARSTATVTKVGGCDLTYTLPDYPSSGTAESISNVQKYYDRDDSVIGSNNCDNPRLTGPVAKVAGNTYDTEHVFEKHFIKRFLYFLVGGYQAFDDISGSSVIDPVAPCDDVKAVFNKLNPAGTNFRTETAAQQLGKAISCKGSQCPDDNRVEEFFLLRTAINGIKNRIFTGHYTGVGSDPNDNKLPSCSDTKSAAQMQQMMTNAAMVFQYMNKQEVYTAFKAVHERIQGILGNLDADMLGSSLKPQNLKLYAANGNTWLDAYNEFMMRFLVDTERKMGLWLHNCKQAYMDKIEASSLSQANKDAAKRKVTDYESGTDVYADAALKLNTALWNDIRGNDES
ncbi:hypothetical protein AB5N19_13300 [Seiridium cardinale]